MKLNDLKNKYLWDDRRPFIQDNVLMIPHHYSLHDKFDMPHLHSNEIFGNDNPVYIEFCSGNGEWVIEMAKSNPSINWIAVECKFKRVSKIWSKMKNNGLDNLFIVYGKAEEFCKYYTSKQSIENLFINFPDPWFKKKHAKHRLIQQSFVEQLATICNPGGCILIVTDNSPYRDQIIDEMRLHNSWENVFDDPFYKKEYENYGSSFFHKLWISLGRDIHYMKFRRKSEQRDSNPRPSGPKPDALAKLRYAP